MDLYGIIGYPLGHSFSQRYFSRKFSEQQIQAVYNVYPITEIHNVRLLFQLFSDLQGINVTIPYKQAIIPFLDQMDPEARAIGAVNVVRAIRKGDSFRLIGYNSDVYGFEVSLRKSLPANTTDALILGTGGAAVAVAYVLTKMNIRFKMVSRTPKDEQTIAYRDISDEIIQSCSLIVNTTPLGTFPRAEQSPDIPYHLLSSRHLLFDLVYNPALTEFMRQGQEQGAMVVNGSEMLELQAEKAWEIWNTPE